MIRRPPRPTRTDTLFPYTPLFRSAVDARAAAVQPGDCLDVLFTSGTTGLPKGVVTTHEQNLRAIAAWSACVGLNADDRYLIVNPFFHSFGYKVGWQIGRAHV